MSVERHEHKDMTGALLVVATVVVALFFVAWLEAWELGDTDADLTARIEQVERDLKQATCHHEHARKYVAVKTGMFWVSPDTSTLIAFDPSVYASWQYDCKIETVTALRVVEYCPACDCTFRVWWEKACVDTLHW